MNLLGRVFSIRLERPLEVPARQTRLLSKQGRFFMRTKSWGARTKPDLIIEVWEALDCESVGAREIEQIQQALREKFGEGTLESPASIARTVAEEGAVLRHQEVFACDMKWRERLISDTAPLQSLSFSSLTEASESIRKLESWRSQFAETGKQVDLHRLQEFALKARQELQLVERSRIVKARVRSEAAEIVEWLTIWMRDPVIFEDWLSLRKRSAEFVKKFD
jgi:hypothetical protein